MSCSSNQFLNYLASARESSKRPLLKYSKNKYKTECNTLSVNSPVSEGESQSTLSIRNSLKKGKIKILNNGRSRQKKKATDIRIGNNSVNEKSPKNTLRRCLIQAPPSMKAVSNFKTMREASLPRSISAKGNLVDLKLKGLPN